MHELCSFQFRIKIEQTNYIFKLTNNGEHFKILRVKLRHSFVGKEIYFLTRNNRVSTSVK